VKKFLIVDKNIVASLGTRRESADWYYWSAAENDA